MSLECTKRWEVFVSKREGENIVINCYWGLRQLNATIYVTTPNWLEQCFHITLESKVTRAIAKQQKQCDIANAKEDESDKFLARWKREEREWTGKNCI